MDSRHEVVHGFDNESLAAKMAWFQTLTIEERLQNLAEMYDFATALNPRMREGQEVGAPEAAVRVITRKAG